MSDYDFDRLLIDNNIIFERTWKTRYDFHDHPG